LCVACSLRRRATIAGGDDNTATSECANVGGGFRNVASKEYVFHRPCIVCVCVRWHVRCGRVPACVCNPSPVLSPRRARSHNDCEPAPIVRVRERATCSLLCALHFHLSGAPRPRDTSRSVLVRMRGCVVTRPLAVARTTRRLLHRRECLRVQVNICTCARGRLRLFARVTAGSVYAPNRFLSQA
jgi:hypothetical protein